jgi:acyl-CoA reductase-like NAD-dependent aldehyde dehydrogenase
VIGSTNFPLLHAIAHLAPALAAGNTVVLRVDENTPLSVLRLALSIEEAALPNGVVNIIVGYTARIGDYFSQSKKLDKLCIQSSTA